MASAGFYSYHHYSELQQHCRVHPAQGTASEASQYSLRMLHPLLLYSSEQPEGLVVSAQPAAHQHAVSGPRRKQVHKAHQPSLELNAAAEPQHRDSDP